MKFDKEHIDIIIKNLEAGNGRVRACQAAKISYQGFLNWMEDPGKVEFVEAVKKAEAVGEDQIEMEAVKAIRDKFSDAWQSAAWWLERTKPGKYKERKEVGTPDNQPIKVTIIERKIE